MAMSDFRWPARRAVSGSGRTAWIGRRAGRSGRRETDEVRKKRMQEVQQRALARAGRRLGRVGLGLFGSPFGGIGGRNGTGLIR